MDNRFFLHLLHVEPEMRDHALQYLSRQVMRSQWDRIDRDTLTATARIARWLLQHDDHDGRPISLGAGQQGLAEELGLSRVTVNRVLGSLTRSGAVRVRRSAVEILDPGALWLILGDRQPGR